jgi:hypothetical protein
VFPPIVKVIVDVGTVEEWAQVYSVSTIQFVNPVIVVRFVESLFATEKFTTLIVPSAIVPVPIIVRVLNPIVWPVFVRTAPLFTVRDPLAARVEAAETVPAIVRSLNN